MPSIEDAIRKSDKRLKALRKTASAHNRANRIFVYKRDGQNVSEDALRSQLYSRDWKTREQVIQRLCKALSHALKTEGSGWTSTDQSAPQLALVDGRASPSPSEGGGVSSTSDSRRSLTSANRAGHAI